MALCRASGWLSMWGLCSTGLHWLQSCYLPHLSLPSCVHMYAWLCGYSPGDPAVIGLESSGGASQCHVEAGGLGTSEGSEAHWVSLAPSGLLVAGRHSCEDWDPRPLAVILGLRVPALCPSLSSFPACACSLSGGLSTDSFLNSAPPKKLFTVPKLVLQCESLKLAIMRIPGGILSIWKWSCSCHSPSLSSSVFKLFSVSVFFPLYFVLNWIKKNAIFKYHCSFKEKLQLKMFV